MVSVSNVPIDGRVIRSVGALAAIFDKIRLVGFSRGEEKLPPFKNIDYYIFLLKEKTGHGFLQALLRKASRLWILIEMAWAVLSYKADVYYSHEAHLLPVAWLAAKLRGAKIVYDIHEIYGEMGEGLSSNVLKFIEVCFIRSCNILITTNADRAKRIAKIRKISSEINVIRNLPIISNSPLRILNVYKNPASIKCLYHGRISLVDRALDVMVRVIGLMPGFELVILGIDSLGERAKLEAIAAESTLENIFLLDPIPPDQLVSFSVGADIGILPYRNIGLNTALASPNKIWEYIASGLFVLSSPFPEAQRLFETCPCGITADLSDEHNFKKLLKKIASMPNLEERKKAGKNYFENHLSWDNEAKKLKELVLPLLSL
jgi:glycosyltransferase involved in cell wall biosynthesis